MEHLTKWKAANSSEHASEESPHSVSITDFINLVNNAVGKPRALSEPCNEKELVPLLEFLEHEKGALRVSDGKIYFYASDPGTL